MRYFNLGELSSYRACLMGVATIMILCCHASVWCTGLPSIIRSFLVLGNLGVDIFLFLSGYGLYLSLEHSNNGSAETLNSKMRGYRAQVRGVADLPFFMYRMMMIFG